MLPKRCFLQGFLEMSIPKTEARIAKITISLRALDISKSKFRWEASILVDVYSLTSQGKDKNDQGMDNVMDTIRTNLTDNDNLLQYNITLAREAPFVDEGASQISINNTGLNINSITINFVVRL